MAIPTILSGAAGRALQTLAPVTSMATHAEATMASGITATTFRDLSGFPSISAAASKDLINAARADVGHALGADRVGAFQAELHAGVHNLDGNIAALGRNTTVGGKELAAKGITSSAHEILSGIGELQAAATSTARRRVILGSLATGAGLGGVIALADALRDHGVLQAPGPFKGVPGFVPAVDPTGIVL
jgi:hypothetical protein